MAMFNPAHPGQVLRDGVFSDASVSVTDAAEQLGVSRTSLSRLINGKAGISPDMAIRLGLWLNGPSADAWMKMQAAYDLWQARQKPLPTVKKMAA